MKATHEGLGILLKYVTDDSSCLSAEHDEIYAQSKPPNEMSDKDRERLEELGWFWVERSGGDPLIGLWQKFT